MWQEINRLSGMPPVEITTCSREGLTHTAVWSKAYRFFDNTVDAHGVRDEGGFTVRWLVGWLRFIGLGFGYISSKEYVNHFLEKEGKIPSLCTRRRGFPPTLVGWLRFIGLGFGYK